MITFCWTWPQQFSDTVCGTESRWTCELVCEDDFDELIPMCSKHENIVAYMGGYLLQKVGFSTTTPCDKCATISLANGYTNSNYLAFTKEKTFHETSALLFPSGVFCQLSHAVRSNFHPNVPTGAAWSQHSESHVWICR